MEFWLKQDNETFKLPVPPKEYTVSRSCNNGTIEVENIGEVSFIGKTGLATATLESFFPNKVYNFCQYRTFPKPKDCVAIIEKWQNSGKPVRYTITGTNVNMECTIENFEYKEQDGTGDIFFTLELKEYRRIVLETQKVMSASTVKPVVTTSKRPVVKSTAKTYTVVKGDSLWLIAKKVYGNGNRWKEIQNKNKDKIKNANLIYPGQVLLI